MRRDHDVLRLVLLALGGVVAIKINEHWLVRMKRQNDMYTD